MTARRLTGPILFFTILTVAGCFSSGPSVADDLSRGNAKRDSGDVEGALSVYNAVLENDPKNTRALMNRGLAEVQADRREAALADYNQAISLDPDYALAYYNRGDAKNGQGDFEGAMADYTKAIALPLASSGAMYVDYSRFRLALTLRRLHRDDTPAGLAAAVAKEPEGWTKNVGRFLTGQLTEAGLLAAAAAGDEKTAPLRQCEAYYYAGFARLLQGDRAGAYDLFGKCLGTGVKYFKEYDLARAELARQQ